MIVFFNTQLDHTHFQAGSFFFVEYIVRYLWVAHSKPLLIRYDHGFGCMYNGSFMPLCCALYLWFSQGCIIVVNRDVCLCMSEIHNLKALEGGPYWNWLCFIFKKAECRFKDVQTLYICLYNPSLRKNYIHLEIKEGLPNFFNFNQQMHIPFVWNPRCMYKTCDL